MESRGRSGFTYLGRAGPRPRFLGRGPLFSLIDARQEQTPSLPTALAAGVEVMTGRTHYDVLGVTADATPALLRAAYKARIRETHPDTGGDPGEAAQVNDAFAVLSNITARDDYDRILRDTAVHSSAGREGAGPTSDSADRGTASAAHNRQRDRPSKRLLLVGIVLWLSVVIGLSIAAGLRAAEIGQTSPELVAIILGVGAVALVAMAVVRAKWWIPVVAALSYSLFAGYHEVGGYGTALLMAAGLGFVMFVRRRRVRRIALATAAAEAYWQAAARPGLSACFVSRAMPNGQTCTVQLVDVSGRGAPDITATMWGSYPPGTYIVADLGVSPSTVLVTATLEQMKLAKPRIR